jgi:excinuclease UvrABC ATPase subunit
VVRDVIYQGGMCSRCEGMGSVSDIDLSQLYDDTKSLNEGALTIPGYTADGWHVRIFAAAGTDSVSLPIGPCWVSTRSQS